MIDLPSIFMESREYDIVFSGLSLGEHRFSYELRQDFYDLFEFDQEFVDPFVNVELLLTKANNMLTVGLEISGHLDLFCDVTTKQFTQEIKNKAKIIVKFGDDFDNSDDEILVIPENEVKINLNHQFYELTLLSIPAKRYHPDLDLSNVDSYIDKMLNKNEEKKVDPRWDALNKIKKDFK